MASPPTDLQRRPQDPPFSSVHPRSNVSFVKTHATDPGVNSQGWPWSNTTINAGPVQQTGTFPLAGNDEWDHHPSSVYGPPQSSTQEQVWPRNSFTRYDPVPSHRPTASPSQALTSSVGNAWPSAGPPPPPSRFLYPISTDNLSDVRPSISPLSPDDEHSISSVTSLTSDSRQNTPDPDVGSHASPSPTPSWRSRSASGHRAAETKPRSGKRKRTMSAEHDHRPGSGEDSITASPVDPMSLEVQGRPKMPAQQRKKLKVCYPSLCLLMPLFLNGLSQGRMEYCECGEKFLVYIDMQRHQWNETCRYWTTGEEPWYYRCPHATCV
jgi:hypothetical protein